MSVDGCKTVLVLGGVRSGKSEFARSLVGDDRAVRWITTAADSDREAAPGDQHRARRPETWTTERIGADPSRLIDLVAAARPGQTLLVDDLAGWVGVLLGSADRSVDATIGALAAAIHDCVARLVLVSPEVGLSPAPPTPDGQVFVDTLGTANQAVARSCDAVALVVAGQPAWLKPGSARAFTAPANPAPAIPAQANPAQAAPTPPLPGPGTTAADPTAAGTPSPPTAETSAGPESIAEARRVDPQGPAAATNPVIRPGLELPLPDEDAGSRARQRLGRLDIPGAAGLGGLDRVVEFAAATQGRDVPTAWPSVRVLLLHGDHRGGCAAGVPAQETRRRIDQARHGEGAVARLAAAAGASLRVVETPAADPIETGAALSTGAVESALRYGWRLAEEAADSGVDLIVLAARGSGSEAAVAAVLAVTAGAELTAVLPRVLTPDGRFDDPAWMIRCAAVRDAVHRVRRTTPGATDVLAQLGGGDIAVATGVLLGAAARRTPVLLDGPVGVAAALVSRDFSDRARHWCLLPDRGAQPAVRHGVVALGLAPLLDLGMDLGEGAGALAALPLLRSALLLANALPPRPAPADDAPVSGDRTRAGDRAEVDEPLLEASTTRAEPDGEEFAEPEPAGPGPTAPAEEPPDEQVFDAPTLPSPPDQRPDPYWPVEERPDTERDRADRDATDRTPPVDRDAAPRGA